MNGVTHVIETYLGYSEVSITATGWLETVMSGGRPPPKTNDVASATATAAMVSVASTVSSEHPGRVQAIVPSPRVKEVAAWLTAPQSRPLGPREGSAVCQMTGWVGHKGFGHLKRRYIKESYHKGHVARLSQTSQCRGPSQMPSGRPEPLWAHAHHSLDYYNAPSLDWQLDSLQLKLKGSVEERRKPLGKVSSLLDVISCVSSLWRYMCSCGPGNCPDFFSACVFPFPPKYNSFSPCH